LASGEISGREQNKAKISPAPLPERSAAGPAYTENANLVRKSPSDLRLSGDPVSIWVQGGRLHPVDAVEVSGKRRRSDCRHEQGHLCSDDGWPGRSRKDHTIRLWDQTRGSETTPQSCANKKSLGWHGHSWRRRL